MTDLQFEHEQELHSWVDEKVESTEFEMAHWNVYRFEIIVWISTDKECKMGMVVVDRRLYLWRFMRRFDDKEDASRSNELL